MDRPPVTAYLVCATPRSGSTLLCETLRATGIAGRPLEHFEILRPSGLPRQPREYLADVHDRAVLDLLPPTRDAAAPDEPSAAWAARIRRAGCSANGVWGGKLMWGHVADLLERGRRLGGLAAADLAGVLDALLGDVRFVFVTRADKVAQAVSLWRAIQTQRWRADESAPAPREQAAYSFTAIDHLVARLEHDDHAWRRWFRSQRLRPLHVAYEQLSADPRATVADVLRFLGLPADELPAPALRHQADARSRAWARRYRLERRAAA